MYTIRPPFFYRLLLKKAVWRIKGSDKCIYLTFDDGPIPEVTPWVLKTLEEFNAKATFFCIGKNAEANRGILKEIILKGHAVGNHTSNHLKGWRVNTTDYLEDVAKCDRQIKESTDQRIKLFRPPYGKLKPSQYSGLKRNYSIIMWDVLSGDFDKHTSPAQCLNNVISNTRNGSVIVMHDSLKAKEKLFYVLPELLKYFTKKGFAFKAIS
jgi:peptidoglycan-N-acetylglucosamine deacetylase